MKKYFLLKNLETNEYYAYYRSVDYWTKDINEAMKISDKDNIESDFDQDSRDFLSGVKLKIVEFIEF